MLIQCCNTEMIYTDGYPTCHECGRVDMSKVQYVCNPYKMENYVYKTKVIYYRNDYFDKVIRLLGGVEIMNNKIISKIAKQLKESEIKNIYEIKKWLKKNKYNKFVKYIYSIYFLAYGEKLISLSNDEYNKVKQEFIKFDKLYKDKIGKRNQFNYYFIIYKIFDKLGIPNDNILLPNTTDKLELNHQLMIT